VAQTLDPPLAVGAVQRRKDDVVILICALLVILFTVIFPVLYMVLTSC
jgi:hypothetical protein